MATYSNILVTGGTGTFGNAFVKRVLDDGLAGRVVVFSRDEAKQSRMARRFDDPRLRFLLGDVRDRERLRFALRGVDAVAHAAALKQVSREVGDVLEFVKTNVMGTANVIMAAHEEGVGKVVVLGSDKGVSATTFYGGTKFVAESLAVAGSVYGPARICAVRYGNIVGSRGSVLEVWQEQVTGGSPMTITDERMTRFWMSIDDAVNLVLLALDRMRGGEVFIPKDVSSSSVVALARCEFPGAELKFLGGKRGVDGRGAEKYHEWLVAVEEVDRLRDCGDCYVLLPPLPRWEPGPYGVDCPPVGEGFEYRSGR